MSGVWSTLYSSVNCARTRTYIRALKEGNGAIGTVAAVPRHSYVYDHVRDSLAVGVPVRSNAPCVCRSVRVESYCFGADAAAPVFDESTENAFRKTHGLILVCRRARRDLAATTSPDLQQYK